MAAVKMNRDAGKYGDWRCIDYKPALADLPLDSLIPYLRSGQRALDIGCNTGRTALWLHGRGLDVVGVDINADAVRQARESVNVGTVGLRFIEGDFLDQIGLGTFEIAVMVRVLTCFPELTDWRALLNRALEYISPGGLIYIHDFLSMPENDSYRERYKEGVRQGWRIGNFAVPGKDGGRLFVAHHHSVEEVHEIMEPYEKIFLKVHDSISLNGNVCRMFEFLGRRNSAP